MTILDSIRRVLAEDAAHPDLTHEVFLRQETVDALETADLGVPHSIQDVARDTIVTYRAGRAISSTYL